ncbi:hypothetical protein Taro_054174 [Colocasia esculenta]|uniref:Uncharacterized protein n=1 Tax=Colocasia esculenta TaxID=4460 RepID=A0A843XPX4_COLES|nr:hypothetical protein [Colocasia esculenta]
MEMKKIACAVLLAAASATAVLAGDAASPAPAPTSGSSAAVPVVGSLVGATVLSFFAYYLESSSFAVLVLLQRLDSFGLALYVYLIDHSFMG